MRLRRLEDGQYPITEQTSIVVHQRQVHCNPLLHRGIGTPLGDAVAVRLVGHLLPHLREVLLTMGLLDMREPRRPFAHAMPPPEQSAGRAHHGGLDIRRRPHPPAEPHGHRVRINLIVFSLAAVNRCHREGMPEHKRSPLTSAEVGEPVPGQETLDGHDASGATWCHGPEEYLRTGLHVLVETDRPSLVQETDRPAPGMPTDAAIQVVLFGVKLPGVSSPLVTWCVPVPADHDGMRRRGLHTYQKFAAHALLRPFLRRSRFRQRLSPNVGLTHRERAHRLSAPLPRSQSTLQHLPSC